MLHAAFNALNRKHKNQQILVAYGTEILWQLQMYLTQILYKFSKSNLLFI